MNDSTRQKALNALDGMAQIVRNEMLVRENYFTDVIDAEKAKAGAICGGRQACAIGSLWLAAGVKVQPGEFGEELPGVHTDARAAFLTRRPGLRVAYDALNDAAQRYVDRHRIDLDEHSYMRESAGPMERLFEHYDDAGDPPATAIGKPEMLRIIAAAKRRVKAA